MVASAVPGAGEGRTLYVTLEPCAHQGRTPPARRSCGRGGRAWWRRSATDPRNGAAACAAPRRGPARLDRPARQGRGGDQRTLPGRGPPWPSLRAAEGRAHARRAHRHRERRVEVDHEPHAAPSGPLAAATARRRGGGNRHRARRRSAAAAAAAHAAPVRARGARHAPAAAAREPARALGECQDARAGADRGTLRRAAPRARRPRRARDHAGGGAAAWIRGACSRRFDARGSRA